MKYTTINIQGNLISEEMLQKIDRAEAPGQTAAHFGLEQGANLRSLKICEVACGSRQILLSAARVWWFVC